MPTPDQYIEPAQKLITNLYRAFEYTRDNNRDLVSDTTFSMYEVAEELEVERSYQFLVAFIQRNFDRINAGLKDD